MLEELLNNLEKIENTIFSSLRKETYQFNEEDIKILKNFGTEIGKCEDLLVEVSSAILNTFNAAKNNTQVLFHIRDLYILLSIEKDYSSSTNNTKMEKFVKSFEEKKPTINETVLKEALSSIIDFKPVLNKAIREYEKNQERLRDDSLFDDSKIDKQKLIRHLKSSLKNFEKVEALDEKEKEKVIIYYKEVIKEVEKEKPLWAKVYGMLGAIGLAVTLYVGIPEVVQDINNSVEEVTKGLSIEGDIPKMEKMKRIIDLNDNKQIENFANA